MIAHMHRTPGRVLKGELDDLFFDFRRCLIGKGLRDWRLIYQALKSFFLEGPLVLIKLASGNTVAAAGFGDVS
jgi:hypothetical protein